MQLTAKLVQVLPLQSGEGKNGTWRKQDIIVETDGKFPKKVCVSIWGDKIDESQLQVGKELDISFDVESREFNGRWYTDVKAWKIEDKGTSTPAPVSDLPAGFDADEIPESPMPEEDDDLPF